MSPIPVVLAALFARSATGDEEVIENLTPLTNILNGTDESTIVALDFIATPDGRVRGWVEQSNLRGTWDIVWTCLVTTFICTYTLLNLNIPAPSDTPWILIKRRLFWMVFAVFAPEIVLTYAAGQWSRAKHSVKAFHGSGYTKWSLKLAFFADMGGFRLSCPGTDPFPLNAKQLHWLVVNGFVDYPKTSPAEIWDKSKQDRLAKLITSFQIGYLVVQCIGRLAQGLAITTLELNTLAIVVCSLMTAFTWLHKPSDVATPIDLHSPFDIADIIRDESKSCNQTHTWTNTPLDFIDQNGPGWSMNVQPFMTLPVIPEQRPIQRIPNDRFPMDPYGTQEYFLCFATLVFTGLHVAGWNMSFPTYTEQVLWRVASLILFGVTAAFWILETMASWVRLGRWKMLYLYFFDRAAIPRFRQATFDRLDQEEQEKPRDISTLPLPWEFWSIAPIAILYGIARVYQLVEGFMELREIDASAFVHVEWTQYLPHV
ncbi:uncharacterized protein J7T54_001656 [Emericellopsis cladophorae]|uniref:Uncharacterized protein n=1 Tax=Emericellopsis cladophorae TaxID=2686198 RepID=A0A9P9Y673_9HYPO|nr:uncharacterized protein J7T54_001656 [Emericellopsis cladophorae]KAI6783780.1 hypothetical protein J7T54_001656 [Emericellopsis cladophorae]